MMKYLIVAAVAVVFAYAAENSIDDTNRSKDVAQSAKKEKSSDINDSKGKSKLDEELKKQMEREKKYAKEQTFYQGSEYNLKEAEVDPNSLSKVPVMNPEYDFDMDDVYSD